MTVSDELIDSLLADYKKTEDRIGEHGLLKQPTKRFVERALEAERVEHLGYAKHQSVSNEAGNTRNGKSQKTLRVCFKSQFIKSPQHQIYHDNMNKGDTGISEYLVIFTQSTIAIKPGESAFHHPAAWQQVKAFAVIWT